MAARAARGDVPDRAALQPADPHAAARAQRNARGGTYVCVVWHGGMEAMDETGLFFIYL